MSSESALADHVGMFVPVWESANPLASRLDLKNDEIHLWAVDLDECGLALMPYLTPSDRLHGERITNAGKRRQYLGGRAGVRLLLSAYTGMPPQAIRFSQGPRGKPGLCSSASEERIRFNYSLSRGKVLYAFSTNQELGVDLETLPRSIRANRLASKKLTDQEREVWKSLPAAIRRDAMLCCWTRKEAYGKALGVGIRYHMSQAPLFENPESNQFQTLRVGLFPGTDVSEMPRSLAGVQIGMPFSAVAALVYPDRGKNRPCIRAKQMDVNGQP